LEEESEEREEGGNTKRGNTYIVAQALEIDMHCSYLHIQIRRFPERITFLRKTATSSIIT
jgi:hypothetical protein